MGQEERLDRVEADMRRLRSEMEDLRRQIAVEVRVRAPLRPLLAERAAVAVRLTGQAHD
jgi:hypothetical protein